MTTICAKCIYLHGTAKTDQWWRWLCTVRPMPADLNVVTGLTVADPPYAFCKKVNDGNCIEFVEGPNVLNPVGGENEPV